MTPSGLHLTIFTSLIFLLLKGRPYQFIFLILLGFASTHFNHIDSFQRMIFFAALRHNPWYKVTTPQAFFATFGVLFFQYLKGPLSFSLSFLFLGIILSPGPHLRKLGYLLIGQFLISFWFNQNFYLFGPLYGLLLTASSFVAFPIVLGEFIIGTHFFTTAWVHLLEFLYHFRGPVITLPFPSLIPFLLMGRIKIKRMALLFGILLMSSEVYHPKVSRYQSPAPAGYEQKIKLKNGVKLLYANGMRCYSRLKADQWISHCYK